MFNVEVFWHFDTGVKKNISAFYTILYETFSNRETFMMCFNQPILQLYQAHKNL